MSNRSTRIFSLSLALLLASTSLASAGFIWLSPDDKPVAGGETVYSRQGDPAAPAEAQVPADPATQGRAWAVEPSVPVAGAAPVAAPSEVVMPPTGAVAAPQPMELSATPPASQPVELAAPAPEVVAAAPAPVSAPAAPPVEQRPVLLQSQTLASQPIYSPGDQPPVPAVSAPAPAPAPAAVASTPPAAPSAPSLPMDLTSAAPVAPAPASAEVKLASSSDVPVPAPLPGAAPGGAAADSMPTAQSMIDAMPSMTAPRAEVPASTSPAPTSPTPAPAVETTLATTVVAPPPAAPMSAPAGVAISPVTGEALPVSEPTPVSAPAAPVPAPVPAPVSAPSVPAGTEQVVEGFGKHVPLVIAMRQILPAGYSFAHGEGVDLSQSVDWKGGRPWPQVLDEAIKPVGLSANLTGDAVMLVKAPVEMAPELTPPQAPAAIVAPVVTSPPVPGAGAVLTNATIMQNPPAN